MTNAAAIAKQTEVDAEFAARIASDYDPHGFVQTCEEHDHCFLTYCVLCPEDHGNGRESDAARKAKLDAHFRAMEFKYGDIPF